MLIRIVTSCIINIRMGSLVHFSGVLPILSAEFGLIGSVESLLIIREEPQWCIRHLDESLLQFLIWLSDVSSSFG